MAELNVDRTFKDNGCNVWIINACLNTNECKHLFESMLQQRSMSETSPPTVVVGDLYTLIRQYKKDDTASAMQAKHKVGLCNIYKAWSRLKPTVKNITHN